MILASINKNSSKEPFNYVKRKEKILKNMIKTPIKKKYIEKKKNKERCDFIEQICLAHFKKFKDIEIVH